MTTIKPISEEKQLISEIVRLYDDFTEFNDRCAFLCDAFASIVSEPQLIDKNTINGFSSYACWLKHQVEEFKFRLSTIQIQSDINGNQTL